MLNYTAQKQTLWSNLSISYLLIKLQLGNSFIDFIQTKIFKQQESWKTKDEKYHVVNQINSEKGQITLVGDIEKMTISIWNTEIYCKWYCINSIAPMHPSPCLLCHGWTSCPCSLKSTTFLLKIYHFEQGLAHLSLNIQRKILSDYQALFSQLITKYVQLLMLKSEEKCTYGW